MNLPRKMYPANATARRVLAFAAAILLSIGEVQRVQGVQQPFLPDNCQRSEGGASKAPYCEKLGRCVTLFEGRVRKDPPVSPNTVIFKPYRGSMQRHETSLIGTPLIQAILEHDGTTRLLEQWERQFQSTDAPRTYRQPLLFTEDSVSDSILIVRNRQLLVLPRALLAHPAVARCRVKSGDSVFTFSSRDNPANDAIDELIRRACLESPESLASDGQSGEPEFVIDPVFDATAISAAESLLEVVRTNGTRDYKSVGSFLLPIRNPVDPGQSWDPIGETLINSKADSGLSQPVFLIIRRRLPGTLVYVVPFPNAGPLGQNGQLFRSLFTNPNEDLETRWSNSVFVGLQELSLEQDDRVVFTRLERIPCFPTGVR